MKIKMKKVWFTSDLHFGHRHVLKHCPKRLEKCGASDVDDIATHDEWLIKLWNDTVEKKDYFHRTLSCILLLVLYSD